MLNPRINRSKPSQLDILSSRLSRGFRSYLAQFENKSILGASDYSINGPFCNCENLLSSTVRAVITLRDRYDLAISLARDGLWLGYMFKLGGLPVSVAKVSRKGRGAQFEPITEIRKADISGKKVLFLDLDAITGRTLDKSTKIIGGFSPECMDVLFMHNTALINVEGYKRYVGRGIVPSYSDSFVSRSGAKVLAERILPHGIEIVYGKCHETFNEQSYKMGDFESRILGDKDLLFSFPIERNCPKILSNIFSLSSQFNCSEDYESLTKFEKELRKNGV